MEFYLSLIAIGLSIYALHKIGSLEKAIKSHITAPAVEPDTPPPPPGMQEEVPIPTEQDIFATSGKNRFEHFISWVKVDWPLKAGALLVILGFVWLVTYAFLNNWIGPAGRITLGLITGSAVMVFGNSWFGRSRTQGHVLVATGASIMLVTIVAAQFTYEMFPAVVALGITALVMVLSATISVKHNSRTLAVISLLIGGLAPILTNSPEASIAGLYSYLLALSIGVLWLTRYKHWQFLTPLALLLVSLYSAEYFGSSAAHLSSSMRPTDLLYLKFFAVTFTTLFFGASLAGTLSNEKIKPTLGTAALVGLFALGWISGIVPTHNQGIITAIVAVTFATGAYLNFNITRVKESVYTFTAIACILLVAATGYQFDGPTLVITFAVQAMILPIFAHKYLSKKLGYSLLLYHILPLITSLDSWSSREWDCPQSLMPSLIPGSSNNYSTFGCTSSIFHADFFALLIVTASLALTGYYFYQLKYSSDNKQEKRLHNAGVILVVMGTIYGLLLIARTLTAVMAHEDTARMILLIIYTIVGLTVYLNGQVENRIVRNRFGLILLLLVIGRLLLVEVWDMNIAGRIITFFLIGTLLMSSVLLRSSHKTGQT